MQDFIRSKQGPHTSQGVMGALPKGQPNGGTGTPESDAREHSGSGTERQSPKAVENDEPMTSDHTAKADKLYNAWKKDALCGRPAGSTQMEADKASPKRARGRSHERRTLEPSSSQTPSACSSDMTIPPDSDPHVRRRLEPMPVDPPMGAMGSRGKGKSKGGGEGRGKRRGKSRR